MYVCTQTERVYIDMDVTNHFCGGSRYLRIFPLGAFQLQVTENQLKKQQLKAKKVSVLSKQITERDSFLSPFLLTANSLSLS